MIRAIFFDLDGTLRHNSPSGSDFFAEQAIALGLRATAEDRLRAMRWEHYYWANSPELIADRETYLAEDSKFWGAYARRQLVALGASNADADRLAPPLNEYMGHEYKPKSVVPEDAIRLLGALKQTGYVLGVLSNRDKPFADEIEELGLRWASRRIGIVEEHLASDRLSRALARCAEALPSRPDAPRILLAAAEGEDHLLGLALVDLCVREEGWRSLWSGRVSGK